MSLLDNAALFDFESSGLADNFDLAVESWPTELAWGIPATGEIASSLINPIKEWTHWVNSAEQITGISRALLKREGRAPIEVLNRMVTAINGRTLYCDNLRFDVFWLQRLVNAAGVKVQLTVGKFQDLVYALAVDAIPDTDDMERDAMLLDQQRLRLVRRAQMFAQERAGKTHRAAADVRYLMTMASFVATNGANPVIPYIDPPVV